MYANKNSNVYLVVLLYIERRREQLLMGGEFR